MELEVLVRVAECVLSLGIESLVFGFEIFLNSLGRCKSDVGVRLCFWEAVLGSMPRQSQVSSGWP